MTTSEAAIISAYTGILIGRFSDMHAYVEKLLHRPVMPHEFTSKKLSNEIKAKSKKDFCNITIQ